MEPSPEDDEFFEGLEEQFDQPSVRTTRTTLAWIAVFGGFIMMVALLRFSVLASFAGFLLTAAGTHVLVSQWRNQKVLSWAMGQISRK